MDVYGIYENYSKDNNNNNNKNNDNNFNENNNYDIKAFANTPTEIGVFPDINIKSDKNTDDKFIIEDPKFISDAFKSTEDSILNNFHNLEEYERVLQQFSEEKEVNYYIII